VASVTRPCHRDSAAAILRSSTSRARRFQSARSIPIGNASVSVNTNKDIQERTNLGFDAITKLQQFAGGLNEPKLFPKELLGDSKHLGSDACSVFQINSILGSIHLTSTEIT
jgi:hypothetical protein